MRFDLKTKASPEQVLRALTDFTDARLQIWNRTLDPKTYELRDSVETWPLRGKALLDGVVRTSPAQRLVDPCSAIWIHRLVAELNPHESEPGSDIPG